MGNEAKYLEQYDDDDSANGLPIRFMELVKLMQICQPVIDIVKDFWFVIEHQLISEFATKYEEHYVEVISELLAAEMFELTHFLFQAFCFSFKFFTLSKKTVENGEFLIICLNHKQNSIYSDLKHFLCIQIKLRVVVFLLQTI